jgi:(R)-citramalate synthase
VLFRSAKEKLAIARALLETLQVDSVEVASARVSEGEHVTLRGICDWARRRKLIDRIEILSFVDHKLSVDWARSAGCHVLNLLTKGSRKHCEMQLGKSLAEHLADIRQTVQYGLTRGVRFNIYLEDWSGGMLDSPDHVWAMMETVATLPFGRLMLPDTLGLLEPRQVSEFVRQMVERYPGRHFDFHGHNDYGLATANSLAALRAGARGIHGTMNGMGERAGNTTLDEVVVAARDFGGFTCRVDEKKLHEVSRLIEVFTGRRVAWNKPITGDNVFTQTAGIHADGDKKGLLYYSRLTPDRFDRRRDYALGKLMGKASLDFNLKRLNIELSPEQKKIVLSKIIEMADQKKVVTTEDLPYIISDVLEAPEARVFDVKDFSIVSNKGLRPMASVLVRYRDKEFQATASGDGGYDAVMKAIKSLEGDLGFKIPRLMDYTLRIPPGGKTDALVEATILWEGGLKTRAVNCDQLQAAIEATSHAINTVAVQAGRAKTKK